MPALPPPMPSRDFLVWAHRFGIGRLARSLNVRRRIVEQWTQSQMPQPPKIWNAQRIVYLSRIEPLKVGPLDLHDIYGLPPKP